MPFDRFRIESALQAVAQAATPAMSVSPVPVAHYTRIDTLSHFLSQSFPRGTPVARMGVRLGNPSPVLER